MNTPAAATYALAVTESRPRGSASVVRQAE